MGAADNTFVISGEISDRTVRDVTDFLLESEDEGVDIVLRITSEGGDASAGMALFDIIRGARIKVTTEAFGDVASAAFLVFVAGHRRRVAPYCRLMWHDGWMEAKGNYDAREFSQKTRYLQQLDHLANLAVSEATGIPVEQVEMWSHATTYFTAADAIAAGLAHEYIREVTK